MSGIMTPVILITKGEHRPGTKVYRVAAIRDLDALFNEDTSDYGLDPLNVSRHFAEAVPRSNREDALKREQELISMFTEDGVRVQPERETLDFSDVATFEQLLHGGFTPAW